LSTIKIALPDFETVNDFTESVLSPIFSNKFATENENAELSKLRDTLLPKLISGEIQINAVD
jgi:type I restriction enzyme S subunit